MHRHAVGTREEWLSARLRLLEAEKELTRKSDELARLRQDLPWVPVTKDYRFDTEHGDTSLKDLFRGRSQLLVYHFMFGPNYRAGCPSCSSIADGFDGFAPHLAHHDVSLVAVSSGPIAALLAFRDRMGWSFPWASSAGSDFNQDFAVSFTERQQRTGAEYNFRTTPAASDDILSGATTAAVPQAMAAQSGVDLPSYFREAPGLSAFAIEDQTIYHTYSAYSRGLDALWGMYQWLDRAPRGRNENGPWLRHRDTYDAS